MSTLCTFPGRFGDIAWALPTVRAISEYRGEPVDLAIGGEFASILPLINLQPYIRTAFAIPEWGLTPPEEWRAPLGDRHLSADWDEIVDLGYRGWPEGDLARYTWEQGRKAIGGIGAIDLERPWISGVPTAHRICAIGFTEAWFELKLGLMHAAIRFAVPVDYLLLTVPGSRWITEGAGLNRWACSWVGAAESIRNSDLFVGDCSALHVLAVGLGKRCVIVEPMIGRHNPIFFPLGKQGNRVTLVLGNDGEPTFDARHVKDAVEGALRTLSQG